MNLMRRFIKALQHSFSGLRTAYKTQWALRIELLLLIPIIPIAFWLGQSSLQRAVLIASCLLVIMAELFNSAIEAVVDRISYEQHPLSKQAKDIAVAGVLLAIIIAAIIWLAVIWTHF